MRSGPVIIAVLTVLLMLSPSSAHVPAFAEAGLSPDAAYTVEEPAKSWVFYGDLPEGPNARYYRFRMEAGERIRLILQTPQEDAFTPGMVIMGPGIVSEGTPPPYITVPAGFGAMVVPGENPDQPSYEPFTPSRLYETAELDMPAPATGEYYVAVCAPERGGNYALALGYVETYGLVEWIMVPVDVIGIRLWEGQSLLLIFAPLIVTLGIGAVLILRKGRTLSAFAGAGVLAGLLYIGTGAMTLMQMVIAATRTDPGASIVLTLVFALIPILLGIAAISVALRAKIGARERISMAALGTLGLVAWAGLVVGPVLAIAAALMPKQR